MGEQLAIFAKAGVALPSNSSYAIPSGKVGEVFSSITKSGNSRADSHLEIVQMLRAGVNQTSVKGGGKKKKLPSAKQILSSMGLHQQPSSAAGAHNSVAIALHSQSKNLSLNSALNFSTGLQRQQQLQQHPGKAALTAVKNQKRSS